MSIPIIATIITLVTLIIILTERMNRAIAAMLGAVIMVLAGLILGFYSEEQAIASIEFDVLGLLLGMMILVSLLEPTGIFQSIAIKAGQLSRGSPFRLLILLSTGTALISLILSNVTTVVLVAPLTILITELLGLVPYPLLDGPGASLRYYSYWHIHWRPRQLVGFRSIRVQFHRFLDPRHAHRDCGSFCHSLDDPTIVC